MRKRYAVGIAIIMVVIAIWGVWYAQPPTEASYLKKSGKELNLDNPQDYSDLNLISESIKDKEIIFTGEGHGIKENIDIQLKFLNYLIDEWDLKYYGIETGHAEAMMLNEYLATGDEELLKETFTDWSSFGATMEKFEMMKKLYKKNSTLSEDKKIIILGIDSASISQEHINKYFKLAIKKAGNLPSELLVFENNMNKLDSMGINTTKYNLTKDERDKKIKEILSITKEMQNHIKNNKELYEKTFKNDLFHMEFILESIVNIQSIPKVFGSQVSIKEVELLNAREKYTYENFKKLYEYYPKGKYYIHYGRGHTALSELNGIKFIGAALQNDENFRDKIYSLRIYYGKGTAINGYGNSEKVFSEIPVELDKQLKLTYGDSHGNLIIDLSKKRSPLKNSFNRNYFAEYELTLIGENPNKVTTDYFQGIIIVDNPNAVTFYN